MSPSKTSISEAPVKKKNIIFLLCLRITNIDKDLVISTITYDCNRDTIVHRIMILNEYTIFDYEDLIF